MSLPPEVPDSSEQTYPPLIPPLDGEETVVRFVESDDWILWDDEGRPQLKSVGIPEKDLRGATGEPSP